MLIRAYAESLPNYTPEILEAAVALEESYKEAVRLFNLKQDVADALAKSREDFTLLDHDMQQALGASPTDGQDVSEVQVAVWVDAWYAACDLLSGEALSVWFAREELPENDSDDDEDNDAAPLSPGRLQRELEGRLEAFNEAIHQLPFRPMTREWEDSNGRLAGQAEQDGLTVDTTGVFPMISTASIHGLPAGMVPDQEALSLHAELEALACQHFSSRSELRMNALIGALGLISRILVISQRLTHNDSPVATHMIALQQLIAIEQGHIAGREEYFLDPAFWGRLRSASTGDFAAEISRCGNIIRERLEVGAALDPKTAEGTELRRALSKQLERAIAVGHRDLNNAEPRHRSLDEAALRECQSVQARLACGVL